MGPAAATPTRVLAVCLGNICRSPTAEAALREAADTAGVDLVVDSAGTGAWHVGNRPDERMRAAGDVAGLAIEGAARQVTVADFDDFDVLLAMDASNLADLRQLAPSAKAAQRLHLFRDFDPDGRGHDVPDPYYGGPDGFIEVVQIARRAAKGVVAAIAAGDL